GNRQALVVPDERLVFQALVGIGLRKDLRRELGPLVGDGIHDMGRELHNAPRELFERQLMTGTLWINESLHRHAPFTLQFRLVVSPTQEDQPVLILLSNAALQRIKGL